MRNLGVMAQHNELGKKGEDKAAALLQSKGHQILARNYRTGRAEVDIISRWQDIIVFTEVKARSSAAFGHPDEFVDEAKQEFMMRAASQFLYENKLECEIRYDVISILFKGKQTITRHVEDAFFPIDDGEFDN